ncbi:MULTISPECIES: hypothetical protein [unclassified Bartonella]|uniref:hypothetical protein n=1 Tax=unclassified Bartonella TaxID=2645622 RepID=UPI0035CEB03D
MRLCHVLANGDRSRFGMTAAKLRAALSLLESNRIRLNGVHLHVGSNLNSTELIVSTLTKAGKDIYALKDQISFYISLGEGYPTSTAFCDAVTVNDEYSRKIYEALSQLGCDLHKLTVIIESRRIISEDYGYLFSNISSIKERNGTNLITILALGMCARSAQYHENRVPQILSFRDMSGEFSLADVVGSNCYEYDILVRDVSIKRYIYPIGFILR